MRVRSISAMIVATLTTSVISSEATDLAARNVVATAQVPPRSTHTKNVVLVVVDGLRWQEVFDGADSSLIARQVSETRTRFWRPTVQERRVALMPFLWNTVAHDGVLFGDRSAGNTVRVTNGRNVSYPGYVEILTGKVDVRIRDNDAGPNASRTWFGWLASKPEYAGRVVALGTWKTFDDIFSRDSAVIVRAGWRAPYASRRSSAEAEINGMYRAARRRFGDVADDTLMQKVLMHDLRSIVPRALFVGYGETDEWAHAGRYDRVLQSAHVVDSLIGELWTTLQSMPEYRGTTTMLVTTDHGRGATAGTWRRHDEKTRGADETWIALIGPDTPAGERRATTVTATQIAATLAAALGEDYLSVASVAGLPIAGAIRP